jgi:hypothetical protein
MHLATVLISVFMLYYRPGRGPGVAQWLRHCATSWKVPGLIPCVAGVFSVAFDSSMCPGIHTVSKNEYQVNPGGKGGWCIRLTTYHHTVLLSSNLGSLTNPRPLWACMPVTGVLYLYRPRLIFHGPRKISLDP